MTVYRGGTTLECYSLMWFPPPSINFHTLSAIKKERDKVEKKLAIATKDYTNAVNRNRGKFFSKLTAKRY